MAAEATSPSISTPSSSHSTSCPPPSLDSDSVTSPLNTLPAPKVKLLEQRLLGPPITTTTTTTTTPTTHPIPTITKSLTESGGDTGHGNGNGNGHGPGSMNGAPPASSTHHGGSEGNESKHDSPKAHFSLPHSSSDPILRSDATPSPAPYHHSPSQHTHPEALSTPPFRHTHSPDPYSSSTTSHHGGLQRGQSHLTSSHPPHSHSTHSLPHGKHIHPYPSHSHGHHPPSGLSHGSSHHSYHGHGTTHGSSHGPSHGPGHHGPYGYFHHFHNPLARSDACIVAEEEKGAPASGHHCEAHDEMHIFSDEEISRSSSDFGGRHPEGFYPVSGKRKRKAFTKDEDEKITEGHEKFGNEWEAIVEWGHLDRTPSQVRDRYRRITKNSKKQKVEEKEVSKLKRVDSHHSLSHSSLSDHSNDHHLNVDDSDPLFKEKERLGQLERELQKREKDLKTRDDEFKKREEELKRHEHEFQESKESTEHREQEYHAKVERVLCDLLTKNAEMENAEIRQRILQNNIRLGRLTYERHASGIVEVWQPGTEAINLDRRLSEIAREKEEIEKERKALKKRFPKPLKDTSDEYAEKSEILSIRLLHLKKEETELLDSKERLIIQNNLHIRETKRIADEDRSRFNNHPLLQNRYLLLQLLGKGGFSEVYKAYDLRELREVACKIHQLNTQWSEQKKRNYSKHVVREYNIHKSLIHPRVVRLYDVFEVDENSFCTVLEYCNGGDLDMYLKNHPILNEREAKSIVYQIFRGLKYLNEQKRPVIHYDLKPGNILFHNGEVKITDFGLSKFYEEDSDGTELTSQGAGTYWYQPPECFETGEEHPKISCKVDVWAAGVIFYQMLYGRKPFGNGISQQKFLSDHTLASAPALEFPPKPAVSDLAKHFIRDCLTFQQKERPDVLTLVNDEYFTNKKNQSHS